MRRFVSARSFVSWENVFSTTVLVGVLWTTIALAFAGGVSGLVVGLGTGLVAAVAPAPVAFALAHVGLLAVFPDWPGSLRIISIEIGLLVLLFGSLRGFATRTGYVMALATLLVLAVGTSAITVRTGSIATGAIALLVATATLVYGFHRYELVSLGVVQREDAKYE